MDPLTQYRAALAAKFRTKAAALRSLAEREVDPFDRLALNIQANEDDWAAEAVEKELGATVPATGGGA